VVLLSRVSDQIIQFDRRIGIFFYTKSHRFPIPLPYRLFAALLNKFPVQVIMFLLAFFSQQGRAEGDPIYSSTYFFIGYGSKSRKHIPKGGDVVGLARLDGTGPIRHHGYMDSAFI